MRKLSVKQKNIIKEYFENDLLDNTNVEYNSNVYTLLRKLEPLNDYETLYQDTYRLLNDLQFTNDYIKTIDNFN